MEEKTQNQNVEPAKEMTEAELSELLQIRRDKLKALQDAGQDPFRKVRYDQQFYSTDITSDYDSFEDKTVSVAGRMMSKRIMGKASFAHILDYKGDIQIYVKRDDIGEESYAQFKTFDIGDIIGVVGRVFKTRTGEISIHAEKVELLSKSLRPLPEKFHGLKDPELRYRQRFVDLIVNPEVRDTFVKRSIIISEMRSWLNNKGFIEVETPVLNTTASGASARPFITHHNTLDIDMYMRIATELHLKMCIVGGLERVYEIGRIFRNEGMDATHNPEFTTIELYQAFTDFHGMMDLVEELYKRLALKICGSMAFKEACLKAGPTLLEPIMKVVVTAPDEYMGDVMGDINARRGQIVGTDIRNGTATIECNVPLSTMFGYATDLRSKTQGRATYSMEPSHFVTLPKNLQEALVKSRAGFDNNV